MINRSMYSLICKQSRSLLPINRCLSSYLTSSSLLSLSQTINNNKLHIYTTYRYHNDHEHSPAHEYLEDKGIRDEVIIRIIKSFPTYPTVSELEAFGDKGIAALKEAVERELKELELKGDKIEASFIAGLVGDSLALAGHYEYDAAKIKANVGEYFNMMSPGEGMGGKTHGVGWGSANYHV